MGTWVRSCRLARPQPRACPLFFRDRPTPSIRFILFPRRLRTQLIPSRRRLLLRSRPLGGLSLPAPVHHSLSAPTTPSRGGMRVLRWRSFRRRDGLLLSNSSRTVCERVQTSVFETQEYTDLGTQIHGMHSSSPGFIKCTSNVVVLLQARKALWKPLQRADSSPTPHQLFTKSWCAAVGPREPSPPPDPSRADT